MPTALLSLGSRVELSPIAIVCSKFLQTSSNVLKQTQKTFLGISFAAVQAKQKRIALCFCLTLLHGNR